MPPNGHYTERGIKNVDGCGSEKWCVEPDFAVKLDSRLKQVGVLMKSTTDVVKAWEKIRRVGERSWFDPQRVLVTGAGPVGLLAAMLGAQPGLDIHVLDRVTSGPKPGLVRVPRSGLPPRRDGNFASKLQPDVMIEATGAGQLVFRRHDHTDTCGALCLTWVSRAGRKLGVDAGGINAGNHAGERCRRLGQGQPAPLPLARYARHHADQQTNGGKTRQARTVEHTRAQRRCSVNAGLQAALIR